MCGGGVLTTAIAIAQLFDMRIPFLSGGTEQMYLAALMIWRDGERKVGRPTFSDDLRSADVLPERGVSL